MKIFFRGVHFREDKRRRLLSFRFAKTFPANPWVSVQQKALFFFFKHLKFCKTRLAGRRYHTWIPLYFGELSCFNCYLDHTGD